MLMNTNSPPIEPLQPIITAHLFAPLDEKLIDLLRSLEPNDWEKQTLAPKWKVIDVAAHLLHTQLGRLSNCRDSRTWAASGNLSNDELVALVNRINQEGVSLLRRLSPRVLISLLEVSAQEFSEYMQSLDPFARACVPVSWAGEEESENWFDIAREFTERWHHQEQIRLAVGKPGIMTREFYWPVLDCFMRALPYTYRKVEAQPGAMAQFNVTEECGGSWFLFRSTGFWELTASPTGEKISETTIPQEIAWRIFTKGISKQEASTQVKVNGNTDIGLHVLNMLSIIG
jgi:uncharacterized protein (TIGR03083 family)